MKVLISSLAFVSGAAFGHARFRPHSMDPNGKIVFKSNTPPRNDSTGLKTGPCGDVPKTTTPTVYKPGQEIVAHWEETINHPGYFGIKFSTDDVTWTDLLSNHKDTLDDSLTDGATHIYSAKIKLPNVTCDKCTLQLIQYMTEDPANPRLYYSCSDIQLQDGAPVPETKPDTTQAPPAGIKPAKPSTVKIKQNQ